MLVATSAWDDRRKRLRQTQPIKQKLFLDSGGFVAAQRWGDFPFSEDEYASWLEIMNPTWCATMDYCLEPELERQDKTRFLYNTVEKAERLITGRPHLPWVPVIQGYEIEDYLHCVELYRETGLLRPYMGVGSLCRRESSVDPIVLALGRALPETRFHLFGIKLNNLGSPIVRRFAASSDSGAWSWGDTGKGRFWDHSNIPRTWQGSIKQYKLQVVLPRYRQKVEQQLLKAERLLRSPLCSNSWLEGENMLCT